MTRRPHGDREAVRKLARRVHAGKDPLTGTKRYKTGTVRTKAEARQLEARLIQETSTGQHRAAGTRTVAELLDRWYDWRSTVRPIADSTRMNYRRLIDDRINPAIGKVPSGHGACCRTKPGRRAWSDRIGPRGARTWEASATARDQSSCSAAWNSASRS